MFKTRRMSAKDQDFILKAIEIAIEGVEENDGGPFGAIVVKGNEIIGKGFNKVTSSFDPTAHAEIIAIREACNHLQTHQLSDCVLYTSCEPCPMCLGAIYWARPSRVVYAADRHDAAAVGFDDSFIYDEINIPYDKRTIKFECNKHFDRLIPFIRWNQKTTKIKY